MIQPGYPVQRYFWRCLVCCTVNEERLCCNNKCRHCGRPKYSRAPRWASPPTTETWKSGARAS